jgi:hypothetical protein
MELIGTAVEASPRGADWVRARGEVRYARGAPAEEQIWLDVPREHAGGLSEGGDAWLVWLAPLAATLGEPLRSHVPADATLLANLAELIRVWSAWFPALTPVVPAAPAALPRTPAPRTASFFSGGVDSFFTALRHRDGDGTPVTERIDDHLFIWGFDIPLEREQAFRRVLASLQQAAAALERRLVPVVTNLRETRFAEADWSRLAHGAALAGVGHALRGAYGAVLIPSSAGYRDLRFWGSHPLTDPMLSSSSLRVVHDGPAFMRVEKTEYVARHDVARRHLRVCYRSADGGNCGNCNGCYRTMLALDALGMLDQCPTFRRGDLDLGRASRVYCPNDYDIRQFGYIRDLAAQRKRPDIERAVGASLRRSARLKRRVDLVRSLRDHPRFWRWSRTLERWLLRRWIT